MTALAVQQPTLREAWLTAGTLARFAAGGLTWPAILAITNGARKAWWRCAIAEAEERGLVEWVADTKTWRLTDAGREHTGGIE